jgi:hypothetical protein
MPAGQAFGNREGNLPEGINVRGRGGLVVAPGAGRPDWYVGGGPRDARIDGGIPGDRNKRNRSSDARGRTSLKCAACEISAQNKRH